MEELLSMEPISDNDYEILMRQVNHDDSIDEQNVRADSLPDWFYNTEDGFTEELEN